MILRCFSLAIFGLGMRQHKIFLIGLLSSSCRALPAPIKKLVCDEDLTEGHLTAISGVVLDVQHSAWLTSEQITLE